jgi:hypothetical protein
MCVHAATAHGSLHAELVSINQHLQLQHEHRDHRYASAAAASGGDMLVVPSIRLCEQPRPVRTPPRSCAHRCWHHSGSIQNDAALPPHNAPIPYPMQYTPPFKTNNLHAMLDL